jgi:hypothetical protein
VSAESENLQVVALRQTAKPGVTERQDARLALQSTALEARLRLNSPHSKPSASRIMRLPSRRVDTSLAKTTKPGG